MKKILRSVGYIILALFCSIIIYITYIIITELENESQGQTYSDLYVFDSKNIFRDYKEGDRDLFLTIPQEDLDDEMLESLPTYPPSNWKQQNYTDILNIFHEVVFQEPSNEKFRGAFLYIPDCNQVQFGPQNATIFTSKINYPRAVYYSYNINLKDGHISYHRNSYDAIISWPIASLDLSKIRISAEQALQIAEKRGGEEVRIANGNQCEIIVEIDVNSRHGNWVVSYDSAIDMFTSLLRLEINSNTGEVKVLSRGGAGFYNFDPQSITTSLSKNETNTFIFQATKPEDLPSLSPVTWTQEFFFKLQQSSTESF